MPTNSGRLASLLNISEDEAIQFCLKIQNLFTRYVHTYDILDATIQTFRISSYKNPRPDDMIKVFQQIADAEQAKQLRIENAYRRAKTARTEYPIVKVENKIDLCLKSKIILWRLYEIYHKLKFRFLSRCNMLRQFVSQPRKYIWGYQSILANE